MRWTGQQVTSYGAGSWSVFQGIAKRLAALERGVLRRMFGGINHHHHRLYSPGWALTSFEKAI
jgi:hypothetical protein